MIDKEILSTFKNKQVVVTGGTGMIGRQLVKILLEAKSNVHVVSLDKIDLGSRVEHIYGDLTSFEFCKQICSEVEYIFHLAGIKGSVDVTKTKPASFFVPLLMMNTNLLEAARLSSATKVLYTSSIGAYAQSDVFKDSEDTVEKPPMDLYPGWAKRIAEFQIKAYREEYGLENFAVVRPSNVYGPGDNFDAENAMVIPALMSRINSGEKPLIVWGDGSAIRDFAFSKDVAYGMILAMHYGTNSGFVNLGSGKPCSIKELVETLNSFIDFEYVFDTNKSSGFSTRAMDISKASKLLGYSPSTSLLSGLTQTWQWYQDHQSEHLRKINYFKEEI